MSAGSMASWRRGSAASARYLNAISDLLQQSEDLQ
jgi:hypothetical protein